MNLEIQPKNGSRCVLRAGKEIARFNSIEAAEAFVMSELSRKWAPSNLHGSVAVRRGLARPSPDKTAGPADARIQAIRDGGRDDSRY